MKQYIDRHVIKYDPSKIQTQKLRDFLTEMGLGDNIYYINGDGSMIIRIPEDKSSSVKRLKSKFRGLVKITAEPL